MQRLQQMGLDDVATLAAADLEDILEQGAKLTGSTCWKNSPQAKSCRFRRDRVGKTAFSNDLKGNRSSENESRQNKTMIANKERSMITITENAAQTHQQLLDQTWQRLGRRLGVKTSGCSGMAYNLEFVDEVNDDD